VGGDGGDAGGGEAIGGGEAGGGGEVRGVGENSDSSRPATLGASGVSGASGTSAACRTEGRADQPPPGAACGGGLDGGGLDGNGCGLLQAENGGSDLGIGGNSDSGGPEDAEPDGAVCHASAGAGEERSA
jgi:hypothetical protein